MADPKANPMVAQELTLSNQKIYPSGHELDLNTAKDSPEDIIHPTQADQFSFFINKL